MTDTGNVGRVIADRYRLVADLGSGGFGRVWKAHDEALDVAVAVKEMWLPPAPSRHEQAERLTRAAREARNAAKLRDHPHIVAVHDVIWDHDIPWIIMQLVNGHSLQHQLATQGPLSVQRTAQVATALLKALDTAQQAGIVHRDIKPGNILLATDGQVLLTDFGIAVHQGDTHLTTTGMVIGSMEYLAPERANGQQATIASDLFSLGVTLYQAVEGTLPFHGETPTATLAAILSAAPPPPQRAGRLTPLITQLLDKQPDHRPSIPQALTLASTPTTATATAAHQSDRLTSAKQPSPSLFTRRRFLITTAGVAAASAATATWLTNRPPNQLKPLGQPLPQSNVSSVAFSPDGHTLATGSDDSGSSGRSSGAIQFWDLTNPSQPIPLGQPLTTQENIHSVAFSPDGHTLATGSDSSGSGRSSNNNGAIRFWDLTNPNQPTPRGQPLTTQETISSVAFSPDGHTLATGGSPKNSANGEIQLWDLTNPNQPTLRSQPLTTQETISSVAFSPDGHTLATTDNVTIQFWDLT